MSKLKIKKDIKKEKIMVFGTFDGVHKGHLDFFRQAKGLSKNPFLIVSVARNKNIFKIKGEKPKYSEKERMLLIYKHKIADKVILSGLKNHLPHIVKEKPDIIALGYDQTAYVKNLKKDLEKKGIFLKLARLKSFKPTIYKNSILKKKVK